ncbi:MAG: exodeoxyribonuclease VII large subunit [Clostridiales bacterium]|nr:exodeoxyribonuclease VII large subunit [Clostridiales bacterium]
MEQALTPVFRVSELNEYVSLVLSNDPNLCGLRVSGEITGFKRHSSGHLYFSLKDENALVRCVMFRQQAIRLNFQPQDGMQVLLYGKASLYEKDGSFQLYANYLKKSGEGELYLKFLALKRELEEHGWFDETRKRLIPFLPRRVGVVTSGTGAAVQDILNIIHRRFPRMPVVVASVRVQGAGAAEEIAKAIAELNRKHAADVMIVGRGGGSMEDLWAFNEPVVVEAIFNSEIPVISAVGHETDFTIADFVADLRAPTPSAAAELCVPEMEACYEAVRLQSERMRRALNAKLERMRSNIRLFASAKAFRLLENRLMNERQTLDGIRERAFRGAREKISDTRSELARIRAQLTALDPSAVLERGYAILTNLGGHALGGVTAMHPGDAVNIRMRDGVAGARIETVTGTDNTKGE